MVLALVEKTQAHGKHVVQLNYQSSESLPPGQWYWVHHSDQGLALANQSGPSSTLYTGSRLQKAQRLSNEMGYHAIDPLTRQ